MAAVERVRFAALLVGLTLGACAPRSAATRPDAPVVALLPFANESLELRAPELARAAVAAGLEERGYRVLEAAKVDSALRELGYTDGGQLGSLSHAALKAALPADFYAFGTVVEYGVASAVALTRRSVSLKFGLVDAAGKTAYASEGAGQETTAGTEAAGALALHLAGKLARVPDLRAETRTAVRRLLEKLPPPSR